MGFQQIFGRGQTIVFNHPPYGLSIAIFSVFIFDIKERKSEKDFHSHPARHKTVDGNFAIGGRKKIFYTDRLPPVSTGTIKS